MIIVHFTYKTTSLTLKPRLSTRRDNRGLNNLLDLSVIITVINTYPVRNNLIVSFDSINFIRSK